MKERKEITKMFEQLIKRSDELSKLSVDDWKQYRTEAIAVTGAMSTLNWVLGSKTDEQFLKILK